MIRKNVFLGILLLLMGVLITLSGCGSPASDSQVISPTVTLNDTNNYRVEFAHIGKSSTTSTYIYGLVKIKYLGVTDRSYIDVHASFKSSSGTVLFTEDTYIRNTALCSTSLTYNTNTFFTPTYDEGYYFIIIDLSDYDVTLGQISKIDLTITHDSYIYTAPNGHLSMNGDPYRIEADSWYVDVVNDGTSDVESFFTRFAFEDSTGRQFKWTFPELYVGGLSNEIMTDGQSGYFKKTYCTPDYIDTPLGFGNCFLEWCPYSDALAAGIRSIAKNSSISIDEKTKLVQGQIDEYTRRQSGK